LPDSQALIAELKSLKSTIEPIEAVARRLDDVAVMYELAESEKDAATLAEADAERAALGPEVEKVSLMALMSGPHDDRDRYFSIQAGAGGTEACDWAAMLLRMYRGILNGEGFKVEELGTREGDGAGIQSVDLQIMGPYAYGWLSTEVGVHRSYGSAPSMPRASGRPASRRSMSCRSIRIIRSNCLKKT
jgi:peptide chain release factor 2